MSPAERWTIAFTVVFGAFMAVMDTSVVNVSMPHMMGGFGTDLSAITWVATSYSIAEIIMVTMSGWWSALMGRKNFYLASFALFTVGSILCGTATTFPQMIFYRIIQGIGGGALIPISQAILRETFPPAQQGMAMALYGMGVVLAPALGPICGGWLTDAWGWPVDFLHQRPGLRPGHAPDHALRARSAVPAARHPGRGLAGHRASDRLPDRHAGGPGARQRRAVVRLPDDRLVDRGHAGPRWARSSSGSCAARTRWSTCGCSRTATWSSARSWGWSSACPCSGPPLSCPSFTQKILGYPAFESGLVLAPRAHGADGHDARGGLGLPAGRGQAAPARWHRGHRPIPTTC